MAQRKDDQLAATKTFALEKDSYELLLKSIGVSSGEAVLAKEKLIAIDPVTKALLVKWVDSLPTEEGAGDTGATGDTGTQGDTGQGDTGQTGDTGTTGTGASYLYSITVEDPTATEDICMGFTFVAITIQEVQAVVVGPAAPSVTIDPYHTLTRDGSGAVNDILNVPVAITNITTGQNLAAFDDPTIPQDSWIVLETTAQSGTVTELTVTMRYTVD